MSAGNPRLARPSQVCGALRHATSCRRGRNRLTLADACGSGHDHYGVPSPVRDTVPVIPARRVVSNVVHVAQEPRKPNRYRTVVASAGSRTRISMLAPQWIG